MQDRVFKTEVKGDIPPYVAGRIAGSMDCMCKSNPLDRCGHAVATIIEVDEDGALVGVNSTIFSVETDERTYRNWTKLAKAWYPDLNFKFDCGR